MRLNGHLQIVLQSGEALEHVPTHLDYLIGASRQAGRLDDWKIDRVLNSVGGGFRALSVYAARAFDRTCGLATSRLRRF
jgi:hypothetical protein